MPDIVLGPWKVGIDNLSTDMNLSRGAVRDAVNGDFDSDGNFSRRGSREAMQAETGMHSLWTSSMGVSLCMRGAILTRVQLPLAFTALATLPSSDRVSYDELNGEIVFGNLSSLGILNSALTPRSLGLSTPPAPALAATASGGLFAGRYAVGITHLRGDEESGLSELAFADVVEGGGLALSGLAAGIPADVTRVRVYVSSVNGDAVYFAANLPAGTATYALGVGLRGRMADTQYLERMPRGSIVRAWKGRLLVARNNAVYFSEPLRYGLYSPRHGFIQEPRKILMLEPVEGGIFVGTADGVFFYAGTSPKDWIRNRTGGQPPVQGTGARVAASEFGGDLGQLGAYVALWLAPNGFVVGMPDGSLIQPQASRLKLDPSGMGAIVVHDRRAVAALI